jgi:hypothetical protein
MESRRDDAAHCKKYHCRKSHAKHDEADSEPAIQTTLPAEIHQTASRWVVGIEIDRHPLANCTWQGRFHARRPFPKLETIRGIRVSDSFSIIPAINNETCCDLLSGANSLVSPQGRKEQDATAN